VLIAMCALAAIALVLASSRRARLIAAGVGIGALLLAPSVWAVETLGHATSGTFPEGGPANIQRAGGGGFGARGGFGGPGSTGARAAAGGFGSAAAPPLFGGGGEAGSSGVGQPPKGAVGGAGTAAGGAGFAGGGSAGAGGGFGGGPPGGPMGNRRTITQAVSYVKQHGGGTIAVSSQSSAASAIISSGARVAGIGGFSGRESDVSASWLAQRVSSGAIRWVLVEGTGAQSSGPRLAGDTRAGSKAAMTAVTKACSRVQLASSEGSSAKTASASAGATGATSTGGATRLYDCQGDAATLARA
jgi:hypothetical protein